VEINGDRAVFAGCFSGLGHVSSPYRRWSVRMRHDECNVSKHQGDRGSKGALPLNPMESGNYGVSDSLRPSPLGLPLNPGECVAMSHLPAGSSRCG
jgi:hypothetical protein